MRAPTRLAFACLALAGCYSYRPVPSGAVPLDAQVRARLSAQQADRLGDVLPAGTRVLEGTVLESGGDALLLLVPVSSQLRGARVDVLNQRLRLSQSDIVELELKELDRGRTGLLVGAGAVALGAIVVAAIVETGGGDGPEEPPETGERRRVRRFAFPLLRFR